MKNYAVLGILLFLFIGFLGCEESKEEKRKKAIEMMTTQTLGLAYLEEFKLEEAEREFLKMIELAPNDKLGYANLGLVYLRMAKYKEAEAQLLKARKIDADDADISLLLSTVYQMEGKREEAITILEKALETEPDHLKILYSLSELYSADSSEQAKESRKKYLQKLVQTDPDNIVTQIQLTEILIDESHFDLAIERMETIKKQFPEFPKESNDYYNATVDFLREANRDQALVNFTIFHNYLRVSFPYQAGIAKLKGPGGTQIGFPLITYNRDENQSSLEGKSILEVIKFKDVTIDQGFDIISSMSEQDPLFEKATHLRAADFNGDGMTDIYIASADESGKSYTPYLFANSRNGFKNIADQVGLDHRALENNAVFADYDNDGFLDLYIQSQKGPLLYKNADQGVFEDKTALSKLQGEGGIIALFFDMDQDGDLDLFEASPSENRIFRNNGNETFVNNTQETGLSFTVTGSIIDAAIGDFDDDGDVDLLILNDQGKVLLFSNKRQGKFELLKDSGLEEGIAGTSLTVADYNNDGFLDAFLASKKGGQGKLYVNAKNGKFDTLTNVLEILPGLDAIQAMDAEFFDFDNDGYLDLVVAGQGENKEASGVLLYHNDGAGMFKNVSHLLPTKISDASQLTSIDFDNDGDKDLMLALKQGGVKLLRNDGGNLNHYVNMKLVGLRTGSAKNNYFGIGAKVEMRAGDLYQSMVVTDPNISFGLGDRPRADIIRITWTNGVSQNILLPDANQALVESQTLKGSCPFLYTWNGESYEFVKDITWRSALGMPLGIMGGTTKYAFSEASDDYIKIEGNKLQEKDGKYLIQVTSELWETIYMDQIELVVVDHPEEIDIFVPEQFSPPPFPGMQIFQVAQRFYPVSAIDQSGRNQLSLIQERDYKYIDQLTPGKYQGITEMHDLILDPGEAGEIDDLQLFLHGWIFPTDASINMALSHSNEITVQPPMIQVVNSQGKWESIQSNISFPMGKDKTVIVDLKDAFLTNDKRVRIRTNMEIYWDEIFFAETAAEADLAPVVLRASSADIHYRGFSKVFRKGGRYGPHWFDYNNVSTSAKWRDLEGNYTRYGDVLALLYSSDNRYIISNAGDEVSISFETKDLPTLKKGWKRDFLIHSVGWVKDGDFNTAAGNTVDPLPFHEMTSYPYDLAEYEYVQGAMDEFKEEYNTREIGMDDFRNSIKPERSEE